MPKLLPTSWPKSRDVREGCPRLVSTPALDVSRLVDVVSSYSQHRRTTRRVDHIVFVRCLNAYVVCIPLIPIAVTYLCHH